MTLVSNSKKESGASEMAGQTMSSYNLEYDNCLVDDVSEETGRSSMSLNQLNEIGIEVESIEKNSDEVSGDDSESEETMLSLGSDDASKNIDTTRMYMREMGTVDLLDRSGEVRIARKIEEGNRCILAAIALFPGEIKHALELWQKVLDGRIQISDFLLGFYAPRIFYALTTRVKLGVIII